MPHYLQSTNPITVFDSGLGGLSVLKALRSALPHENFLYFGDSAHAPYGEKSPQAVQTLVTAYVDNFVAQGTKALVIACNTATSVAAAALRQKYPTLPIIGMEPALKPAVESRPHPTVLVMATPLTIREEKLQHLAHHYANQARLILVPCPGLAAAIEANPYDTAAIRQILLPLIGPYAHQVDAVVLGCTHYIHIKPLISDLLGPSIAIFDGVDGTVRELIRQLTAQDLLNPSSEPGTLTIQNSAPDPAKIALSEQILSRI